MTHISVYYKPKIDVYIYRESAHQNKRLFGRNCMNHASVVHTLNSSEQGIDYDKKLQNYIKNFDS